MYACAHTSVYARASVCVCVCVCVCASVCVCVLKICIFKHLIKRDDMHNKMRTGSNYNRE